MTKRKIKDEEVLAALDAAVKERGPDFVYPQGLPFQRSDPMGATTLTCSYKIDGHPMCIVGVAMNKIDPTIGFYEGLSVQSQRFVERMSECAADTLQEAQTLQDSGEPWGQAVKGAKEEYDKCKADD